MTLEINTDDWKNRHDILLGEYRHLVMQLVDIEALEISHGERIEKQAKRIKELETQLEKNNPLLDEAADKIDALEETIATQAAVILKLREAIKAVEIDSEEVLDFDEFTAMMVPMDTYHALIEALSIPDDSAQVLKAWLDNVMGEPVAWLCVNENAECEQIDYGSESPLPGDDGFEPLFRKPEVK